MRIEVVSGIGHAATELAAYDAAEAQMGVADCNLIRLSSVIPPGAEVKPLDGKLTAKPGWGDKLYCVAAERRTSKSGEQAWAGIGWIMLDGGKGLFCEHDGVTRGEVQELIRASLMAFMKNRGLEPDESLVHMKVAGTTCREQPACAMVLAAYVAEGWKG